MIQIRFGVSNMRCHGSLLVIWALAHEPDLLKEEVRKMTEEHIGNCLTCKALLVRRQKELDEDRYKKKIRPQLIA
ncbi:MAG: hypothetical protein ACAH35_04065, partial [Candidatus Paceibacterota bacterium]